MWDLSLRNLNIYFINIFHPTSDRDEYTKVQNFMQNTPLKFDATG